MGEGSLVLVGAKNQDQMSLIWIGPSWSHQPRPMTNLRSRLVAPTGTKVPCPLILLFLPLPEPFSSFVLAVLSSGGGFQAHFLHDFVKALDSPVLPTALKVRSLFLSTFIDFVAHIMVWGYRNVKFLDWDSFLDFYTI